MIRADAAVMAREILDEHDLGSWSVTFTRSVRALGVCRYRDQTIGLSGPLTDRNGPDVISDVIRHETAHALAGPAAKHGPAWRRACAITGARPRACRDARTVETVPAPYVVVCPRCGPLGPRYKRAARTMECARCRSVVTFERRAA
jgi:predicted SprT family Zn-dependent metalloprotease